MYPNLIVELKARNITQKEMAERIGISETSFCRKMRGCKDFRLKEALLISRELNPCTVEYLFAEKTEKN